MFRGVLATVAATTALMAALLVLTPREAPSMLVGRRRPSIDKYKPLGYYGCMASDYNTHHYFDAMSKDFSNVTAEDFAQQALEQHFAMSHVIRH